MTEPEFSQVMESLGRIEANLQNQCADLGGMHRTLYGSEGRTGLVADVEALKHRQSLWNRLVTLAIALLTGLGAFNAWETVRKLTGK